MKFLLVYKVYLFVIDFDKTLQFQGVASPFYIIVEFVILFGLRAIDIVVQWAFGLATINNSDLYRVQGVTEVP